MPRLWVQGYHRGRAMGSDPGEVPLHTTSQVTMLNMVGHQNTYTHGFRGF